MGRRAGQGDRRPVGAGHDGPRVLGDQGPVRPRHGPRRVARPVRLRRTGLRPTGRSSPRPARSGSPSASSWPTRPACSPSTSRSIAPWSPTSIGWPRVMARQTPAWPPGERYAYHAISLGFYESELLRRVDPQHRSIGRYFADESPGRSGWSSTSACRRRSRTPGWRRSSVQASLRMLTGMPRPVVLGAMNPRSALHRALAVNPGSGAAARSPSGCTRASSRCRRAVASGRRGRSPGRTACSPPEERSSVCGPRPSTALAAPRRAPAPRTDRRVPEGSGRLLARVHEAHARLAVRPSRGLRRPGCRWVARVRGPAGRHRLRVRHEPDGHRSGRGLRDIALRQALPERLRRAA